MLKPLWGNKFKQFVGVRSWYGLDESVFDNELFARIELDTIETSAQAIHVQPTNYDHVIWARRNDKAICSKHKNTANEALAIDRERLRNEQIPEASRVQTVDFAASGSFSDGSCKGLAGCSPAAGIGVIPFEDTKRALLFS